MGAGKAALLHPRHEQTCQGIRPEPDPDYLEAIPAQGFHMNYGILEDF